MIDLYVDEGYAYDYLAILMVKEAKMPSDATAKARESCHHYIAVQVGFNTHQTILQSFEFRQLIQANELTFDAVQKARYGQISAQEVDDLNMSRYHCKIALQKKFFPHYHPTEVKS